VLSSVYYPVSAAACVRGHALRDGRPALPAALLERPVDGVLNHLILTATVG
jgi:hypothetical protein